jgi:hypothetical protein
MTDRNRATTLRLRTPTAPPSPLAGPPRNLTVATPRPAGEAVPRRSHLQTFVPRRADPTSQAILDELAALGLAEPEERS